MLCSSIIQESSNLKLGIATPQKIEQNRFTILPGFHYFHLFPILSGATSLAFFFKSPRLAVLYGAVRHLARDLLSHVAAGRGAPISRARVSVARRLLSEMPVGSVGHGGDFSHSGAKKWGYNWDIPGILGWGEST